MQIEGSCHPCLVQKYTVQQIYSHCRTCKSVEGGVERTTLQKGNGVEMQWHFKTRCVGVDSVCMCVFQSVCVYICVAGTFSGSTQCQGNSDVQETAQSVVFPPSEQQSVTFPKGHNLINRTD